MTTEINPKFGNTIACKVFVFIEALILISFVVIAVYNVL